MLLALVLLSLTAGALGGRSPHADYIEETFGDPGVKFSNNIIEDASLDVPDLIAKYGYPIELHDVITSDGYILTMHRIPHGKDSYNDPDEKEKPVVIVVPGVLSSSADFVVLGPGKALAYLLAEAGYDVWLVNPRGTYYSRRHRFLRPNSRLNLNFWKFSWDEIGNIDLPDCINYITRVTGQPRMHYIGHSQGCATFLVLTSLRPEYNNRFISFQALAPAVLWENNRVVAPLAPFSNAIETTAYSMGIGEFFGSRKFITWFATTYCVEGSIFQGICTRVIGNMMSETFNETMIPVFLGHSPAGCSVRQISHYGQNAFAKSFRRYDYGSYNNLKAYGSRTPPEYNLNKVKTPTYLYYGNNDVIVTPEDVEILSEKLPHVVDAHLVESPSFDHYDFIWGTPVKQLLYDRVLDALKTAEKKFGK